jgi:uncharacterized membrane protein
MRSADKPTSAGNGQGAAIRLSVMLLGGGIAHFVVPKAFDSIIPSRLPGSPRLYTRLSGAANLCVGTGLAIPRTRRVSTVLALLLFTVYIPAKVKLAIDWWHNDRLPMPMKIAGTAQLLVQIPLVTEGLKARRNAR